MREVEGYVPEESQDLTKLMFFSIKDKEQFDQDYKQYTEIEAEHSIDTFLYGTKDGNTEDMEYGGIDEEQEDLNKELTK